MPDLEPRMARVEGILEEVRTRLNHVEERLARVEERIDRLGDRLDRLVERVDRQFMWLVGVMVTMWVTIILAILFRR